MKKLILPGLFFLFTLQVSAQKKEPFIVKKDDKTLYLDHKVVTNESFFSIGRLYNLSPSTIAKYNKLDMEKGLKVDQKLRVPLIDSNFTQKENKGTPVYYKVKEKEGLLKVSSLNKNVSVDKIKRWNNLKSDNIAEGAKLIIGFLVVSPATSTETASVDNSPMRPIVNVPIEQEKPKEKVEETKPQPAVAKEEVKPVMEQGYFRTSFEQQVKRYPPSKNETVTSGIFKTMSGWQDGKYYLLIDNVLPGTIVRVTNPANNVSVYAKVLGEMHGIKQNEGLDIRLSNAAASILQISETDKFIVKLVY